MPNLVSFPRPYGELSPPADETEARHRAQFFRSRDPFPVVPPALLSAEHIEDYARVTAMLHPFFADPGRLKGASYEARPRAFIRWDETGRKINTPLSANQIYTLPANSITFALIESRIRLPSYIAMRFNLRIKHVHRGLLLGTGPLVDPEFAGDLLIPLHNLTSDDYDISADEGLIWIEFTKTSRILDTSVQAGEIEEHKIDKPPEYYFERASGNNPIRSSIPQAIKEARERAGTAERSARRAQRTNQLFVGIGILALLGTGIALHSYFGQMSANVIASNTLAASVKDDAHRTTSELSKTTDELRLLRSALDAANSKIEALEIEVRRLSERPSLLPAPGRSR